MQIVTAGGHFKGGHQGAIRGRGAYRKVSENISLHGWLAY